MWIIQQLIRVLDKLFYNGDDEIRTEWYRREITEAWENKDFARASFLKIESRRR